MAVDPAEAVTEPATAAHPDLADRTWVASYVAAGRLVRLNRVDHGDPCLLVGAGLVSLVLTSCCRRP